MTLERINDLLTKKEFSYGEPFKITVNNKEYLGILLQQSNIKKISEKLEENNLSLFPIRATEEGLHPATIERSVFVNRYGYFLLDKNELFLKKHTEHGSANNYYEEIEDYDFVN